MNHLRITKESLKIYGEYIGVLFSIQTNKTNFQFQKKVINTCVFKQKVVPLQLNLYKQQ